MLGWILLIVVLAALGVLGTVLELALELLLGLLLVVALVVVGGYLLIRSRTAGRR